MNREPIYQALFNLVAGMNWAGGGSFAFASRRVKTFANINTWPAFCQFESDETHIPTTNMRSKKTLGAALLFYHNAGVATDAIPATTSNAMLDALDLLIDNEDEGYTQTLGGLVHSVSISGRITKEHGDLEGQALLWVPIRILVP